MSAQATGLPASTKVQAGLDASLQLVESAYRFETPERLPFLFWESPRDTDPARDRFVDPHAVEMQLNRWGDWEKQALEFFQGVAWWETQQYSPLAPRMLIPLFCPQETILTPLGVPFSRIDENRIRIDHGKPIVQEVADIERLEALEEGFLERGLIPELIARAKWLVERTDRRFAVGFPDYQSPLGLASKLMDSTEFVYWMVDDPDSIQRLLRLMSRLIAKLLAALESAVGSPELVQAPYLMPESVRGAIWDDYVSILGPDTYCRIVPDVNDELLQQYGGGHLHTCGPCVGPITDAILSNQNVKSFDVIFANAARERFTSHILDLKKRCAGRAVLNVIGMPYDLENFTPDFVKRVNEGGGVIFTACGGSREQVLRWHDIIDHARN